MRETIALVGLVCTSLVALAAWMGCNSNAQSQEPEVEREDTAVPIEAALVESGSIDARLTGTASLEAEEEAVVVARVGGVVTSIFAEEGQYVQAGQPLVQLDDARLVLERQQAAVTLEKMRLEFERKEELHEKQLISDEAYQTAKSDYELQQQVHGMAELDLEYTTVRAPISGIVSKRLAKVGNMIRPNDVTYHVTDFSPLLAVMHVPERELHKLQAGQRATIRVDALPEETFEGYIKRISPVIDPATGTFEATIEVNDRSRQLKPGMFGRVFIIYDTHVNTLLIPKSSVVREDDESTVFVIRDSLAFRYEIVTGYEDGSSIEVLDGLTQGDRIVVTGQGGLRDSSYVVAINRP